MKIKKSYPIAIPNISELERKYLNECIDTKFVSSVGPFVDKFEKHLTSNTKFTFASAVSSGTSALALAQHALGVKYNDLVIIPDYTFIATANAVTQNQALPWIIDIKLDDLNIDFEMIADEINNNCKYNNGKWHHKKTKRELKCIIPVMSLGNFISNKEIDNFNEKIGLPIIVDAAGALGAHQEKTSIGDLDILAATVSFNGNKTFTCGGGGAILTNNKIFHEKVKHLSTTARSGYEYIHDLPAFNYRMTNVQAAIGCAQLERYEDFIKTKKTIFDYYRDNIISNKIIFPDHVDSSRWLSYFIAKKLNKTQLKEFYAFANSKGVFLRPFWVPMHRQPPYKKCLSSSVKNSSKIFSKVITLPSSTSLKVSDLKYVTTIINTYLNKLDE